MLKHHIWTCICTTIKMGMSKITVAKYVDMSKDVTVKTSKLALWMPSAELVKAWGSDKNHRTEHANIVLRRTHTNGDVNPLTICVYTAVLDSVSRYAHAKRDNKWGLRTVITDASSISTNVYREHALCQWHERQKTLHKVPQQGQCRGEQRSRKWSNVT